MDKIKRNQKRARKAWTTIKEIKQEPRNTVGFHVDFFFKSDGKRLYIYLEGTNQRQDWLTNFNFLPKRVVLGVKGRFYHRGFHYTAEMVWNQLIKEIERHEICLLYGYSLGGAAIQILADYIKNLTNIRVEKIVTFGAPRNRIFTRKKTLLEERKNHFRFVQGIDIVTIIPLFPYFHTGKLVELPSVGNWLENHDYKDYK